MKRISVFSFVKSEIMHVGVEGFNITPFRAGMPFKGDVKKEGEESLGLFDASSNLNSFYPGLDPDEVDIKPEDYYTAKFRLLSGTIVAPGSYRATNFGASKQVLKDSMAMVLSRPVMVDHQRDIHSIVGIVSKVEWSEAFVSSNGVKVPYGLDGHLSIDKKTHPNLVRNIQLRAINSNSVTVAFEWEPSHKLKDDEEFEHKVGQLSLVDGKMITRNVTKILGYHETSLVYLGADGFAKLWDGKELVNVDTTNIAKELLSASAEEKKLYESKVYYGGACVTKEELLSLSTNQGKKSNEKMNQKFIDGLLLMLKITKVEDVTEAHLQNIAALSAGREIADSAELVTLRADTARVVTLTKEKTDLELELTTEKGKVTQVTAEKDALVPVAAVGKAATDHLRAEVTKLHTASQNGVADAAMVELLGKADYNTLLVHFKSYSKTALNSFSATCNACQSTNVSLRSSVEAGGQGTSGNPAAGGAPKAKSSYDQFAANHL